MKKWNHVYIGNLIMWHIFYSKDDYDLHDVFIKKHEKKMKIPDLGFTYSIAIISWKTHISVHILKVMILHQSISSIYQEEESDISIRLMYETYSFSSNKLSNDEKIKLVIFHQNHDLFASIKFFVEANKS